MLTTIQPSGLNGDIQAPASKSSMQRACAAALLRAGETIIRHPGHSNDDKAALGMVKDLGALVETLPDGSLLVKSSGVVNGAEEVNCGESGLGLRMFAPIIALSSRTIRVKGEGSLLKRPMDFFDEIFPQLGIRVVSNGGKLPLEIQGPLQPRDIRIDGSLSSQFLTGLLFAFAAAGSAGVTIRVHDLKSKPYIDLTLQVMKEFGWEIGNRNYEEFSFPAERQPDARPDRGGADGPVDGQRLVYTVEGDWSGGAFLLVAGAVAGKIAVKGLDPASTQADKAVLQALRDSGARVEVKTDAIVIGPGSLKAFRFDATDRPDLFPPLVALAAYCKGTTQITGVSRLAHKESDRGSTLRDEFGKMGIRVELEGDVMRVFGGEGVTGAPVHSRHDHRIAMACAVAALGAKGEVTIADAEAVNKSYPDFYRDMGKLGAKVNIQL
jgi:3-phosphoshikimate 1-carboxyvinyltransferase